MAIFSLYRDFFRFLQTLEKDDDPWAQYEKIYLDPYKRFFRTYWNTFFPQMDLGTLQDRVRRVRRGHYASLEQILEQSSPEAVTRQTLDRCLSMLPGFPEPDVYLMVGFFSPDGFVLDLDDWPVLCIGLDRFHNFRLLDIILAHEYGHYARRLAGAVTAAREPETLAERLLSEGLSVCFSRKVFPQRTLCDHLFMSPQRLAWCRENEVLLQAMARNDLHSGRLVTVLFGGGDPAAGIPPRTGMYLGYRLVEKALQERGVGALEQLLSFPDMAAVWPSGLESETHLT